MRWCSFPDRLGTRHLVHPRSFGMVYSYLFIPGDQIPTFDKFDGMHSTIVANLSSGLCGFTLNHSDIGGYNALISPSGNLVRDSQVFLCTNLTLGSLAMDRIGGIRRSVSQSRGKHTTGPSPALLEQGNIWIPRRHDTFVYCS
jgi:hypothetical protein